jgi:hypothetical protein
MVFPILIRFPLHFNRVEGLWNPLKLSIQDFFSKPEVFFFGADRAVLQAFGVVSSKDDLDGAEEGADEFGLLVGEALADAVADRDAAVFQFEDADRDAVNVEDDVGAFGLFALDGDFFGDGEVVGGGYVPVDQGDGSGGFAGTGFDLDAVAEEGVGGFVVVVEIAVGVGGGGAEFVEGGADLGRGVALALEVVGEVGFFDVAVGGAVLPVAEVVVVQFVTKERDYTVLGGAFWVSDITHNILSSMYGDYRRIMRFWLSGLED